MTEPLLLGPRTHISLALFEEILLSTRPLGLSADATEAMGRSAQVLSAARDRGESIYGITTGFGPLVHHDVGHDEISDLQRNLVYHLASGTGEPMEPLWARGVMLARAICLARGHSAMRHATLELLLTWLNRGLVPAIPRYGTVGASGDLTPLAHVALALMGEGEVLVGGRDLMPSAEIIAAQGLPRLELADRDGLALVNGTAAMTSLAALAACRARRALNRAVDLSAAFAEVLGASREAFDPYLAQVRPHPGQQAVTERLTARLEGSQRLRYRQESAAVQNPFNLPAPTVQDAYTLRCIPQLLGAVADALSYHGGVVETELNSVTDNPVVDPDQGRVLHGGNFFGQPVALASDALNPALISIGVLAERQIARLTDESLSGLPTFLQPHRPGLQSGVMGAQVTASSLVAHLRSLATPLSIQSMPTNANNQDVNPMGTLGALRSHEILDRLFEILAVLALCLAQASHLVGDQGFSPATSSLLEELRTHSAPLQQDRPLYKEIAALSRVLDRR